jgi:Flp pilus assembly protein TadG
MNANQLKKRIRLRASARGAAMVEAALMIPILCSVLGLMEFCHAEYDAKLLTMWDAQNQAWTYSTHACINGPDKPGTENVEANRAMGVMSGKPNDPATLQTSKTLGALNTASGVIGTPGISMKNATSTASWSKYQRTVTSQTWVFCNEQNYDGEFGVISEYSRFLQSYVNNVLHHTR